MNSVSSEKPKAMLVNVGGAVAPAIHTLNEQQPAYICFFVSPDSKPHIREKILPALHYQYEHYDWIETTVPQDLLACYRALSSKLPPILEKWGVQATQLAVEYTAGTKPMSVAAVMATIDSSSQYFYVGSKDSQGRDRAGIGVVLDGKESTWFQTNPWEELAVRARSEIAFLFNHGRFADARERAQRLAQVVPAEMQKIYSAIAEMIDGYALWDRFEYRTAQQRIYQALKSLQLYTAGRDEPLRVSLEIVEQNADFLKRLNEKNEEARRLDVLDLLANAGRRAEVAQKYDDATARLYSALEAIARNQLLGQYKIRNNAVKVEQVPESLREKFMRFSDADSAANELKLGLDASYRLLNALGDEIGQKYVACESELSRVLNARNQSRLAHGTEPVRQETYLTLFKITLDFANATEAQLPRFPSLRL